MAPIWNDDPSFQITNTITMPFTKVYVDRTLLLISYKPRQPFCSDSDLKTIVTKAFASSEYSFM